MMKNIGKRILYGFIGFVVIFVLHSIYPTINGFDWLGLAVGILIFGLLLVKFKGKRKRLYFGGLAYVYFISLLQITSNPLFTGWGTFMITAFGGSNDVLMMLWLLSLVAMTLLTILPRSYSFGKRRYRRYRRR